MARHSESNDPLVIGAIGAGTLLASALAAIGSWIGYSKLMVNHQHPLPPAIEAERLTFNSAIDSTLSYYVSAKPGTRPLVLIHSINAAASSYEMRPIFEHYRAARTVYALDLPGFGFSERPNRRYSPDLYQHAIADFIESQVRGDQPVDVIALSLGSEFVALAAHERPYLFHSLALISPSGFTDRRNSRQKQDGPKVNRAYQLFSFPIWSQAFYDLLTTRASLEAFLRRSFEGKVDPGLLDYAYYTSHQPGARVAPLYFISGQLFSPDIRETVYEQLKLPVLVIHDKDGYVRFDLLPDMVKQCPNWETVRIQPTKGLPQFEKMAEVAQALDEFWAKEAQTQ